MKIGVFTDSYKPYTSGVVRSIETFTCEFIQKGHKVYIFGPDYPVLKSRINHEEGVYRFLSIPAPRFSDFNIAIPISPQLRATIKKIGLDIIHVHSPFIMGGLGARAARRARIPLVFTYHTLYDQYYHYFPIAGKASGKLLLNYCRRFSNRCDIVITPSRTVKHHLSAVGVTKPVHVIPTGIELEEFDNTNNRWLRQNYDIQEDEKVLMFVGRLGKEKNLTFLLKAFKVILESVPKTKLVIVGYGPLDAYLRKLCAEMEIQNNVIFTGLLPRYKIVHCYASADIFTFPSVTETQGLVIGEAKASGLPVVSVKAFGTSDMVTNGEDGFLTDLSLKTFSGKVIELLTNAELYDKMSRKARENARFISSGYCADLMLQTYEELIESKKNTFKITT